MHRIAAGTAGKMQYLHSSGQRGWRRRCRLLAGLDERAIRPRPDEAFGDMVARALGISRRQNEILLKTLHYGAPFDEAATAALAPGSIEAFKEGARVVTNGEVRALTKRERFD